MPGPAAPRIYIQTARSSRVPYFDAPPVFSGGSAGLYAFEHRAVAPGRIGGHQFDAHVLMLPVGSQAVRFKSRLDGQLVTGLIEPNAFRFLARGDTLSSTWAAPLQGLFLTLPPALLSMAFADDAGGESVQLISNILPHRNAVLTHLLRALYAHLSASHHGGRLFEQHLLIAIATQVLGQYPAGRRDMTRIGTLPRWQQVRLREFIQANIDRAITINDLARAVGRSPYHLARTYRTTTGRSLWQHVLEYRAREARRLIVSCPSRSLAEIAGACGFESYAQFVAAFRKFYAQRPSELRRSLKGR